LAYIPRIAQRKSTTMNRLWRALRRAASALARFAGEIDYAQRRRAALILAPDRYLTEPDKPPDTYPEFLARTHGPLMREPSARARLAGRRVG